MLSSKRQLRSRTALKLPVAPGIVAAPVSFNTSTSTSSKAAIRIVTPASKLPGLKAAELSLLREKQSQLALTASLTLESLPPGAHIRNALEATLIFAQYEAGSAVCIDPAGWVLTCSHCFGDTEKERCVNKRKWLLFYNGLAAQVECQISDPKRDLALAKIIAVESSEGTNGDIPTFRFVVLSTPEPAVNTPIFCIGQPGRDDLESTSNQRTKYNLIEVSRGKLLGMVRDVDPHDNSQIGTLKHNAWTYWGHSGAPLLREADCTLVGLHSSWDDQTAMRHGIPLLAIKHFLEQHQAGEAGKQMKKAAMGFNSSKKKGQNLERRATSNAADQRKKKIPRRIVDELQHTTDHSMRVTGEDD